jgi:hypothetical protein
MTDIPTKPLLNETVVNVAEEYHEVVTDAERFAFLPRGMEYQRDGVNNLDEFIE